jgi:hypothetical protein
MEQVTKQLSVGGNEMLQSFLPWLQRLLRQPVRLAYDSGYTWGFHKVITTRNLTAQYPLIMLTLVNGRNKTSYQKRIVSQAINHFTYLSKKYVPKLWMVPNIK